MRLRALVRVSVAGRGFEPGELLPEEGVDRERMLRLGAAEEVKPPARQRRRGKAAAEADDGPAEGSA